jgi:hypothetical protein
MAGGANPRESAPRLYYWICWGLKKSRAGWKKLAMRGFEPQSFPPFYFPTFPPLTS